MWPQCTTFLAGRIKPIKSIRQTIFFLALRACWVNQINQMNETNQINQITRIMTYEDVTPIPSRTYKVAAAPTSQRVSHSRSRIVLPRKTLLLAYGIFFLLTGAFKWVTPGLLLMQFYSNVLRIRPWFKIMSMRIEMNDDLLAKIKKFIKMCQNTPQLCSGIGTHLTLGVWKSLIKTASYPLPLWWGRARVGVDKIAFFHPPLNPLPSREGRVTSWKVIRFLQSQYITL